MGQHKETITEISMDNLFTGEARYIIPVYQRNYVWDYEEREQLLEDLLHRVQTSEPYFLGNLIVYERDFHVYEVIDGQQRLTTLFILLAALGEKMNDSPLQFEARQQSNATLDAIAAQAITLDEFTASEKLILAYKQFLERRPDIESLLLKLKDIKLLRIVVPEDTDLNHYFERMNTRGKQLEAHEILKARLMSQLKGEALETKRKVFSIVWDACAKMDRYVQMSFPKEVRQKLFGNRYEAWQVKGFSDLVQRISTMNEQVVSPSQALTITEAIETYHRIEVRTKDEPIYVEDGRFTSILTFPNLLLHVLKLYNETENQTEDDTLNDQYLLDLFDEQIDPERFLTLLLKVRFLFDKFIIKRAYTEEDEEDGVWSLQKLRAYDRSIDYVHTYTNQATDDARVQRKIKAIQAVLRITYTAPSTMHWVTEALAYVYREPDEKMNALGLLHILENYARKSVQKQDLASCQDGRQFDRIVYTYLDYVLWRDGYGSAVPEMAPTEFTFRHSLEVFYPQEPAPTKEPAKIEAAYLHDFGNLCFVTGATQRKFSNQMPEVKIENEAVLRSSAKLQIMAALTKHSPDGWNEQLIKEHGQAMKAVLQKDLKKASS